MSISRRSFLARAAGIVPALTPYLSHGPAGARRKPGGERSSNPISFPRIELRGYGELSADYHAQHDGKASATRIRCESHQKALLLQAKYLSDLGLLPGVKENAISVEGQAIPATRTTSGSVIICYAREAEVLIMAARSMSALERICSELTPHSRAAADFRSRARVPMYLDRWDRFGLLIYYEPFTAPSGVPFPGDAYDYGRDLALARENDAGLVVWVNPSTLDSAEGLTDEQNWSWVQETARRQGIPIHFNTSANWPILWLSNRFRGETQLKMPQFLGGFYDVGRWSGPKGAISWFSQDGEDALLGIQQSIVRRFARDPNIVGWLEPHGETSQLPQSLFTEYGALADQSFQEYLKQRFGYLSVLSKRWHGDPAHLKNWSEVRAPELAEFAGFGPGAIDLRGVWKVKYLLVTAGKPESMPEAWSRPDFDDRGWDDFAAPGNDRMFSMPRTPLVYRRTVEIPQDWLAARSRVTLYVWDLSDEPQDELAVYLNGTKLAGQARMAVQHRWMVFDATRTLKAGANLVVINAPNAAICYRIYLTGEPPSQYPELGPHKNAQWADYNAWVLDARGKQMRRGMEMIRQVDPGPSINLMAPGDDFGPETRICKNYGGRFHDTGAMAGFWTDQLSLLMSGAGLPVTAEPGNGAPNVTEFRKFWGRWFTEGVNGVHYFQHLGQILWNPEVLAEFRKNRRMYEAVGKYHVPFAAVGILYSTRNHRLTAFPWDDRFTDRWSRGGYYSPHNPSGLLLDFCPRDGITEEALGADTARKYRVVIDSNTSFWNEETLAGVESYVRAGGVFITHGETGRHTEIEPDAWPISTLTGYAVAGAASGDASTMPAPGQTVFLAAEWSGRASGGLSLRKTNAGCQDLLLWIDGTAAVGMRQIGKGWIVHVGARWDGEEQGLLFRLLLSHFGFGERVPASVTPARGLHFRHFISNTGLHDLWALFNESDTSITTDLTFLPGKQPRALFEIVSEAPVQIVRSPGGDSVRNIALAPHQTILYISPREDVVSAPVEWLKLQYGWWQGTTKPAPHHLPTPEEQRLFTLDLTRHWAYRRIDALNDEQAADLMQSGLDDSTWERRDLGVWLEPEDHRTRRIILRRKFTVPDHWNAGPVYLSTGGSMPHARTFLDGKPLMDGRLLWDGANLNDASGALKPGTSHVLALDVQGTSPPIGVRGPAWLTYVPDPPARQDLVGTWAGYADGLRKTGDVELPGSVAHVAFLSRTVTIDRIHGESKVVLYVSCTRDSFDAILINGSRLECSRRTSDHSYAWFNITPMVRFGEENLVELSLRAGPENTRIRNVELRYYENGFFP